MDTGVRRDMSCSETLKYSYRALEYFSRTVMVYVYASFKNASTFSIIPLKLSVVDGALCTS